MTCDMLDQVGQQLAKRRPTHRPTMNEKNVGSGSDFSIGDIRATDVDHLIGVATKQIAGPNVIQNHANATPLVSWLPCWATTTALPKLDDGAASAALQQAQHQPCECQVIRHHDSHAVPAPLAHET